MCFLNGRKRIWVVCLTKFVLIASIFNHLNLIKLVDWLFIKGKENGKTSSARGWRYERGPEKLAARCAQAVFKSITESLECCARPRYFNDGSDDICYQRASRFIMVFDCWWASSSGSSTRTYFQMNTKAESVWFCPWKCTDEKRQRDSGYDSDLLMIAQRVGCWNCGLYYSGISVPRTLKPAQTLCSTSMTQP